MEEVVLENYEVKNRGTVVTVGTGGSLTGRFHDKKEKLLEEEE